MTIGSSEDSGIRWGGSRIVRGIPSNTQGSAVDSRQVVDATDTPNVGNPSVLLVSNETTVRPLEL